ncbi:alpha/beta fold hydrolase [Pseudoxanthomonas dokdonensis]|uniref:Hydrolase n=1 Tax=Pseudoxanthomonas dokdonensis TaxID=344882 RepID=A0A0R0CH16_9GAMM|nr:alpha/beta hydrolase [Pseudoxanthomonas dokdonensis]KRG68390.1 hydrolase [Pseudoxanthomonas dokdonensis]
MQLSEFEAAVTLGPLGGLHCRHPGAERVIALHGWLDNAASFIPLASHLPDLDWVAPDLPGHGRSCHIAAGTEYSSFLAVNAILDLADGLGWERFSLVGHSMGAGIASIIAAAAPERIRRLVLIEALGALAETVERTTARWREAVAAARALPSKSLRVFPDLEAPIRARMRANHLSEASARLLVERGVKAVPGGYEWSTDPRLTLPTPQRLSEAQISHLVTGIQCPVQVIYAEPAQSYFPEPLRSERAGLLPQGQLATMPGIHHLHMDNPAAVASIVADFLCPTD